MITTYEEFNSTQSVAYGSPATSASVNKAPLFLKTELDDLYNYTKVKFGDSPLEWDAAHSYRAGEICYHNGVIYRALVDNINDEPNNADWEVLDILDGFETALAWDSTTNYVQYDVVTHLGYIYEALQANVNIEPPEATNWNQIGQTGQSRIGNNFVRTNGDSVPDTDDTYSIGSTSLRFANIYATNIHGSVTSAKYADLAEKYLSDKEYPEGTVLGIGGELEVTSYTKGLPVAGVVSSNPGFRMNSNADGLYIALKGRVPCLINGKAVKGQYIVADKNGRGKAVKSVTDTKKILGVALSDGDGIVEIKI